MTSGTVGNLVRGIRGLGHPQGKVLVSTIQKLARCAVCDQVKLDWGDALRLTTETLHRVHLDYIAPAQGAVAKAHFPRPNELATLRAFYRDDVDTDFFNRHRCEFPDGLLKVIKPDRRRRVSLSGHTAVKPYPPLATKQVLNLFRLAKTCLASIEEPQHLLLLCDLFGVEVSPGQSIQIGGKDLKGLSKTGLRKAAAAAKVLLSFLAEERFRSRALLRDFGRAVRHCLAAQNGLDVSTSAAREGLAPTTFTTKFQDAQFAPRVLKQYRALEQKFPTALNRLPS